MGGTKVAASHLAHIEHCGCDSVAMSRVRAARATLARKKTKQSCAAECGRKMWLLLDARFLAATEGAKLLARQHLRMEVINGLRDYLSRAALPGNGRRVHRRQRTSSLGDARTIRARGLRGDAYHSAYQALHAKESILTGEMRLRQRSSIRTEVCWGSTRPLPSAAVPMKARVRNEPVLDR